MSMTMRVIFAAFLFVHSVLNIALASDATFGAELTFTNDEVFSSYPQNRVQIATAASKKFLKSYIDRLKSLEPGYRRRFVVESDPRYWGGEKQPRYKVTFRDGFYFYVFPDPGVIEVTHREVTVEEYRKTYRSIMQDLVFDVMAEVGLKPWDFAGSGHIHMGLKSAFGANGFLLRQYMADYFNHPVLAMGGMNQDLRNAASILELPDNIRAGFKMALASFDVDQRKTVADFQMLFSQFVVHNTSMPDPVWKNGEGGRHNRPAKYHAMHFSSFETLEHRAIRPQASAQMFLDQISMIDARIKYLAGIKYPIDFLEATVPADRIAAAQQFYEYARPADIPWSRLWPMSLPAWQGEPAYRDFQPSKRDLPPPPKANWRDCNLLELGKLAGGL